MACLNYLREECSSEGTIPNALWNGGDMHNQELSKRLHVALVQYVFGCRMSSDAVLLSGPAREEGAGSGVNKDNSKGDRPGSSWERSLQSLGGQGHKRERFDEREQDVIGKGYKERQAKQGKTDLFPFPEPPQ